MRLFKIVTKNKLGWGLTILTAVITGASSGIGEAIAKDYVRRGIDVVLLARRKERIEKLAEWARGQGRRALAIVCDVTQRGELDSAFLQAKNEFQSIDIVVANAGFGVVGVVERLTAEDFRRQFETNIYGVLHTFHAAIPYLKETKGRFAAVGSVNGYVALPGNAPYAMSKFAVRALCDALAYECRADGVSVTHIAPGFVRSEIRQVDNQGNWHEKGRDPIPDWIQMDAAKAARQINGAILKRKHEIVVTGHGKFFVLWYRHCPRSFRFLIKRLGVKARGEAKKS